MQPDPNTKANNSNAAPVLGRVPVRPLFSPTLIRLVGAFGFSMGLLVAAVTAAGLWAGRQEALTGAEAVARNLTRVLTDSVERSINSVDVTLAWVAEQAALDGGIAPRPDLDQLIAQRLAFLPHLRQILVVRADGRVGYDSAHQAEGRRLDLGDLLDEHARLPRPLVIGAPVEGRYLGGGSRPGGQRTIPVSRAVRSSDGQIAALVVGALNPEFFVAHFQSIETESGAHTHLWRFDGALLAGAGGVADIQQTRGWDNPLFSRHLKEAEMGTFTEVSPDGLDWITSYRTALSWPLVISVGMPVQRALEDWRNSGEMIAWPVAAVTLIVWGLTAGLMAMLRRRGRDEARLRLSDMVLNNVSNGVTIADAGQADLPLIYVNPAFEQITGRPAAAVLGRNARFLHEFEPDQEGLAEVRTAIARGMPVTAVLRNRRADGTVFWNQLSLSPVRGDDGAVTHWVGVQRDITRQEEARAALTKAYDEVARYSDDLERFSFVLAHHLQEPARQMRLQAQVLLQRLGEDGDSGARRPAELIIKAAKRLVDMLRDVQAYLAVERRPQGDAAASSEAALAAALKRFADEASTGPVEVRRGLLPMVGLSQKALDAIFAVLVENAVRFGDSGRPLRLSVGAEPHSDGWCFQVSDNGIGIEPSYHQRIFVALERLHPAAAFEGTGIGLAIARRIVESAGGRIWVESDGDTGSTFRFTLPAAE